MYCVGAQTAHNDVECARQTKNSGANVVCKVCMRVCVCVDVSVCVYVCRCVCVYIMWANMVYVE